MYKFINYCVFQVLQTWLQGLPDDYAVKDLISEISDWVVDGYVESTIWEWLQNCVTPSTLPVFSERRHKRKHYDSSSPDSKRKKVPSTSGSELLMDKQALKCKKFMECYVSIILWVPFQIYQKEECSEC